MVGGIYEVVYSRILRGEGAKLTQLLPDLSYSLLLPFIGHEAASAEREQIRRRRPRAATPPTAGQQADA
jgi:hypothetical protein